MKKIFLLLAIISLHFAGNCQVIKGRVMDKYDHAAINFASVYINGTIVGTHTDKTGKFQLDISRYSSMPVTISALGYYSVDIINNSTGDSVLVYLEPKVFELNEVVISSDNTALLRERKRNMSLFKDEFLGRSYAALNCEIINEPDITFKYSANKDTLKAFSSKPLLLDNKALGYSIIYYLDKFEYCKTDKSLKIIGNYLFREDSTLTNTNKNRIERKRAIAYMGSRMHFFRALWNNDLVKSGFSVKNESNENVAYDDLVFHSDSLIDGVPVKYLKYNGTLNLMYLPAISRTKISIDKELVRFGRFGYFDPLGIKWSGDMAKLRIADLLPFDYNENDFYSVPQSQIDSLDIIEKVYLHTDRDYYYPGDDIWFKAYLIDASDRSLTNNSNNLHVELISPDSVIVLSRTVRVENGLGNGDFKLAQNVKNGNYTIRAYTNYLRNFGEELFFRKNITILNPEDITDKNNKRPENLAKKIKIEFFPEGGSLVENISSLVAFKTIDSQGRGPEVSGEIFSSEGDSITLFKTAHSGMGSFYLRPLPGLSYYAVVKNQEGDTIRAKIPKSFLTGVTLSVSQQVKNELSVTIKTNPATVAEVVKNEITLTISARKTVLKTIGFRIKSLSNSLTIPADDLPDGILMLTLSGPGNLPLCERLFYLQRNEDLKLNIESDKMNYEKREQVSLKLSLNDLSGNPQDAFLSLSSSEKIPEENSSRNNKTISSWFLLESDIRGPVESPAYYFDPENTERLRDLNLLLMTQGWRDFRWKYNKDPYLPENGFTISGKLRKLFIDKALESSIVNIGIFEKNNTFSTSIPTDSEGKFRFDGVILTGEARLIVSGKDKKGESGGLLLLDSLKYEPAGVHFIEHQYIGFRDELKSKMTQSYEIINNIRKKYTLSDTIKLGGVVINAQKAEEKDPQILKVKRDRNIYGTPDAEIIITPQLEGYSNLLEVIKGRVPGVMVTGNYPDIKVYIRGISSYLGGTQPIFLLDGSKVALEDILALPLNVVDRIDILKGAITATFGMQGGNGVIAVITRTGDRLISNHQVNNSANILIHGYDTPRVFYSPQHLKGNNPDYEPDFRTTLFWKPDIIVKEGIEEHFYYFNGDNSTTVKVVVEGISTKGIPVTGSTEYTVK